MAILKVSRMGHPVLRQRASEIPADQVQHPDLQRLVEDMVDTMIDYEGIGLAAPQVFQPLRVIVVGQPYTDPTDDSLPNANLYSGAGVELASGGGRVALLTNVRWAECARWPYTTNASNP